MSAGENLRRGRDLAFELFTMLDEAVIAEDAADDERLAREQQQAKFRRLHGELRSIRGGDGAA